MKSAVIGSGAWGTTLAKVLVENGNEVVLWSHDQKIVDEINHSHENKSLLPGFPLPEALKCSADLKKCVENSDLIILVVASQFYEKMAQNLKDLVPMDTVIVSATKGINESNQKRLSEVLFDNLPPEIHGNIAVLSGPNIAKEIALKKVSTTVISSLNSSTSLKAQKALSNDYLRVYTNDDLIGTELGGTLKNIIAIAGGIADGLDLGNNAKSAIMVRGLVEMTRFATEFGAKKETFYGLTGMGDLITTCSSVMSRNHYVGENLGKGRTLKEILDEMTAVAEGVSTAKMIHKMAKEKGIEMPVTEQVYNILFENKPVKEAIQDLMKRETRAEGV